MTASEVMQSYTVIVNAGSGVLVNAMTKDYSYVFTAAHVIKDIDQHKVIDHKGNVLQVIEVLTYNGMQGDNANLYDCVVLKVTYQERIQQKSLSASDLIHRANLMLVGYPETERASSVPIKHYDGHMTSVANELITFTIDGIPGVETIRGMSGGGVYHIHDNTPLLVGIEFKMDGTGEDQQYGRVQCYSLVRFKEILAIHRSAQMIPGYLECFSRVKENIFVFNVIDQSNVLKLRDALKGFTESLISYGVPPPYQIMDRYHSQLLLDPLRPGELEALQLWLTYLEFLVMNALIDNVGSIDWSYIEGLEKKRRLLYTSDHTNWISRLEELLKIAHDLLDKDGTLIVASPDPAAKLLPPEFRLKSVIRDIAKVPGQGPFSIDQVESAIYESFKLTHIEGLRMSCVIDREDEYSAAACGIPQLELFKDKLNEIIT